MEKLELKHLAPYLPFKLKVNHFGKSKVLNCGQGSSNHWIGITSGLRYQDIIKFAPILRPLSDLTKEIEHDEEKFVPMQKLCRECFYKEQYPKDWSFGIRDSIFYASAIDSIMTRLFEYNSKEMMFIGSNPRDNYKMNVKQFKAFQRLFEWHFDVFGLIEKGLAIKVNTISYEKENT